MSLPEPVEVVPPRGGQLRRLVLALVGAGLLVGVIAGVGGAVLGSWSQTEAGLCRITWAPCTELSAASVEQLSGVDLPAGAEVVSGYAQELGTLHEFRAEVVLPEGGLVTMSSVYSETGSVPGLGTGLTDARYWSRAVVDGEGRDLAVEGVDADGRTVLRFDTLLVP